MKKFHPSLLFILLLALLLAGCWDYVEIELLDFVFGVGIDRIDQDFFVITEMINVSGGEQESQFKPVVLSTKGRSLSSAGRALSGPAGMIVFWSHAFVLVVSEEVARQGIIPSIEYGVRSRHMRSTVFVFVTKDCTAEEVFKSKPPFASSVSEHLNSISLQQALLTNFYPREIWQFTSDLTAEGVCATLPAVRLVHESGELVPIVEGTAVFKQDQMVGWLDADESQLLVLLQGLVERGHFVMDTRIKGEVSPITYELLANQVETKPIVEDGKLSMKIGLEFQVSVVEVGDANVNFQNQEEVASMEQQISHAFNRRTREFLAKVHKNYNADVLGLGRLLRRREPDAWRHYGDNWYTHLPNLSVDVEVKSKITLTGLLSQPVMVRD